MTPDRDAKPIFPQVCAKPIARREDLPSMPLLGPPTEEVVISESPLRDGDWVALHPDAATVIEHGNASGVMRPGVIGLLEKWHVVFAKGASWGVRIYLGNIVPELQLTISGEEIGSEYTSIIVQPVRSGHVQSA